MILLAEFSPVLPDFGIFFWTTLIFLIVLFTVGRFAFKPIQEALKKRENEIQSSLDEARKAREEIAMLQAQNEEILKQAQEERAQIMREAKEVKDSIISEAREQAKKEAKQIVQTAKQEIEHQRLEALVSAKNEIGTMAIDIAEKVLNEKLKSDKEQSALVEKMVAEIKFN